MSEDSAFLRLACRIADNLLATQSETGLFPRPGRDFARTGDEAPQALLHLAAALDGKSSSLPAPILDSRFFHCEHDGYPKERRVIPDKRTYDDVVYYGGR
jgi:hypothetical protein